MSDAPTKADVLNALAGCVVFVMLGLMFIGFVAGAGWAWRLL